MKSYLYSKFFTYILTLIRNNVDIVSIHLQYKEEYEKSVCETMHCRRKYPLRDFSAFRDAIYPSVKC